MANVHGFRDIEQQNRAANNYNRIRGINNQGGEGGGGGGGAGMHPLLGGRMDNQVNPRDETFCQMLKINFCPTLKLFSFIAIITIIDVIMYVVSLFLGDLDNDDFLGPNSQTLLDLGGKCPNKMRYDMQLYRWLMPMVLHASFYHILSNMVMQLIAGSWVESWIGPVKTLTIYVVGGIGGILFSSLCSQNLSVGASFSLFAIVGALYGFVAVNWVALQNIGFFRYCLLCMLIMITLINFVIGFSQDNVDNWGHLGGLLTGFFVAVAIIPVLPTDMRRHEVQGWCYEKYWKQVGRFVSLAWLVIGFAMFYTVYKPDQRTIC